MMERLWRDILDRFGQEVALRAGGEELTLQALVQPLPDREGEQQVHSPLGLGKKERYLYLGPAQHPLELDTAVVWKGENFRVQSACRVGEGVCPHWRAVLVPGEEAAL